MTLLEAQLILTADALDKMSRAIEEGRETDLRTVGKVIGAHAVQLRAALARERQT